MSQSPPPAAAPRWRAAAALTLAFCAHLALARGAEATEILDGSSPALAVVQGTEASAEDLAVTVTWAQSSDLPSSAVIRLLDGAGWPLASHSVATVPGERAEHLLPGVLAAVPGSGFQFRLELEDSTGEPLGPDHDFRVSFSCPIDAGCAYRTVDGLSAGSVVLDAELMRLLDTLEAAGSQDVLGDALAAAPELEGAIYTLAKELDDLDQRQPLSAPCSCIWMPSAELSPVREELGEQPPPPPEPPFPDHQAGGWRGPGAHYNLGLQTVRGPQQTLTGGGESRLTMDLRCWQVAAWTLVELAATLPSDPRIEIRFPEAAPCAAACGAEIRHQAELAGELELGAHGTAEEGAWAEGTADASYWLFDHQQDHPIFSAPGAASVSTPPQGSTTDLAVNKKTADQTLAAQRVTAVLKTASTLEVRAGPEAYALALSKAHYRMEATGEAACAVEPTGHAELDFLDGRGDGLAIKRWGP